MLGQQVLADHGPNIVFTSGFAIWQSKRAGEIIFGRNAGAEARTGCDNLELYFESEEIEAELEKLENAGVRIIHPVHEEPWGQRNFRCYDPDGHIVEVGEPMPLVIKRLYDQGYTPESIVNRTSMPMELVLQTIGYPRFC
jgi:hypothetical protein